MKIRIILTIIAAMVFSCSRPLDKRQIFDAKGQKVITSAVSRKSNTVSVLFGNELALDRSIKGGVPVAGEIYTMVTWNQENKKFWYPGLINGTVKSVEEVKVTSIGNEIKTNYTLLKGAAPIGLTQNPFTPAERIAYITSRRASVFP